jgi:hypothetical protein
MRVMEAHLFEPPPKDCLRCPKCGAPARLTHTILDSRRGNTVRLFCCAICGDRLWDDSAQYMITRAGPSMAAADPPPLLGTFSDPAKTLRSDTTVHELAARQAREADELPKE